jgi:hypothetical protein
LAFLATCQRAGIAAYVDVQIPMLARMYEKRIKGYRAIGYEIEPIAGNERN